MAASNEAHDRRREDGANSLASQVVRLIRDAHHELGTTLPLTLVLMAVGVVLEGAIVGLVFPVLTAAGAGDDVSDNALGQTLTRVLEAAGLSATLGTLVVITLIIALARLAVLLASGTHSSRARYEYVEAKRRQVFDALLAARWRFFWGHRSGTLTSVVVTYCERCGAALSQLIVIANGFATLGIYTIVAFAASWKVSLATLGCGLLLATISRPVTRRTHQSGQEITSRLGQISALVEEAMSGVKSLKASSGEAATSRRVGVVMTRYTDVASRNARLVAWLGSTFEVAAVVMLVLILVVGTEVLGAPVTTVLVVSAIFGRLFPRIATIMQARQQLVTLMPSVHAVDVLVQDATADREEDDPDSPPLELTGAVSISFRSLRVTLGSTPALRGVSLDIEAGSHLGIVGPTGSGKSTLVNALLGLVNIESGSIEIDGRPLRELPLKRWRERVGFVPQETILFDASIHDNIVWGREGVVADAAVDRAMRLAGIDSLLDELPSGASTRVGDRGQLLSGGQRQRLGLARALVGEPVLLVLDEATSALDAEGERAVLDAVDQLRGAATTITIAHRLAAVRNADQIVVIEDGLIVEGGTWEELSTGSGRFAAMWRAQSMS